jgi:hypothetical protein
MKKVAIKKSLCVFAILLMLLLTFLVGYKLGITGFRESNGTLTSEYDNTESIVKVFSIEYLEDGKIFNLESLVNYPQGWSFTTILLEDGDSTNIIDNKKYILSSPNNAFSLSIIPKMVTYSTEVLAVETSVYVQQSKGVCLGNFGLDYSTGTKFVSNFRGLEEDGRVRYIQRVVDGYDITSKELDTFYVFKHNKQEVPGEEVVWNADVFAIFNVPMDSGQKEEYLKIADAIVTSLELK